MTQNLRQQAKISTFVQMSFHSQNLEQTTKSKLQKDKQKSLISVVSLHSFLFNQFVILDLNTDFKILFLWFEKI